MPSLPRPAKIVVYLACKIEPLAARAYAGDSVIGNQITPKLQEI